MADEEKQKLTAGEIQKLVVELHGEINQKEAPWIWKRVAISQANSALAYLEDDRYEITTRSANAIREWAAELLAMV